MRDGVSVVIPAYNYAQYLGRAIDSALRQSYSPIEVLLVDDGSTDGTRAIVDGYSDSRLRYIYQANAGLSAARNTGITEAQFPFVAFLDADDEWSPDFLQTVMARFTALPEEFALVASRYSRIDTDGKPIPTRNAQMPASREVTARDITVKTRFMPSAVVARRIAFEKCGFFDTGLRSSEDRDMWIRIGGQFRLCLIAEILVLIRKHASNMSKNAERMRVNKERVIGKARRAGVAATFDIPFWGQVWAIHHFQVAWTFSDEGVPGKAIGHLLRSILCWPLFLRPGACNEPFLFRLRALRTFIQRSRRRDSALSQPPRG